MTRYTLFLSALCVATLALPAARAATLTAQPLDFRPGNAKQAALLARVPEASEIVTDRFGLASVDLDGDGKPELVLRADSGANCGSGGCLTVVLQERGNRMVTLLSQNLYPGLGVTDQKVGAFRALAALDAKGGIAVGERPGTPLYGKPMVYAMSGQAQAAAVPVTSAAPAGRPPVKGDTTPTSSSGGADVVGIRLGMGRDAAMDAFRKHLPGVRGNDRTVIFKGSPPVTVPVGHDGLSGGDHVALAFSGPPSAPVVIEVRRTLSMERGKEAHYGTLLAALTDKYGRPHYIDPNRQAHVWFLDGRGGDMRRGNACSPLGRQISSYAQALAPSHSSLFPKNCGPVLHVLMNRFGNNPELISQMDVNLTDNDAANAAIDATRQHILAAAQRLRAEDAEKAKANRPKL
jgi:hypothetical protein